MIFEAQEFDRVQHYIFYRSDLVFDVAFSYQSLQLYSCTGIILYFEIAR